MHVPKSSTTQAPTRLWRWPSLGLILLPWLVLQIGGLFSPGLLDDVDSIYLQIAREMLGRHDFVTPYIDGIRFFDKPPLMYWLAAGSMRLFGEHDWAGRLPLALGMLALLMSVYALGVRLFAAVSPEGARDRGGLYAALAMATSIGPYLYTRFYIPDMLIALWMTLSVHFFLIALDRVRDGRSALLPSLGFGAVMAADVLTKGLIGIVFPLASVVLYLACTRSLRLLTRLQIPASTALFLLLAAPWHVLAALRNPAIAMPAGAGLPARAGWAWFYLYNEHIARFLGRRIPHDYGQVRIPYFWLLLFLWLLPWAAFLFAAVRNALRELRSTTDARATRFDSDADFAALSPQQHPTVIPREREAALALLLWAGIILGFFTLSSRQEYYHLPALPALALLVGGLLAAADAAIATFRSPQAEQVPGPWSEAYERPFELAARRATAQTFWASRWLLVPLGSLLFMVCGYLAVTAPTPRAGVTLDALLSSNPDLYNLSLGHIFDLNRQAMGFFRLPLIAVALGMALLGPVSHLLRRRSFSFAANLVLTAGMTLVLLAAHAGLVRFYPILGSKELADAIRADGLHAPVLIDGELTSASSVLFYLDNPVLLINGRVNGPWFGSFWPDARPIFFTDADLQREWHARTSLYLLTYHPEKRVPALCSAGPVFRLSSSGGDSLLRNTPGTVTEPVNLAGQNLCH